MTINRRILSYLIGFIAIKKDYIIIKKTKTLKI